MSTKAAAAAAAAILSAAAWMGYDVQKDKARPKVSITTPASGAMVSGLVSITATASDNVTIARMRFTVDAVTICDSTFESDLAKQRTASCAWASELEAEAWRVLVVTAYDSAGNTASSTRTVTSAAVLRVVTETVPDAICGQPYRAVIQATGGLKPYTWSASGLPTWLTLTTEGDDAVLSGTPPVECGDGKITGTLVAKAKGVKDGWL